PTTVILFFSVSNPACVTSLERLHAFVEKSEGRLRVIAVTRDDEARVAPVATPYLSMQMTVAFDTDGKIYKNFGVNYVPFALLTDARNRVLWQGNSLRLNETILSTAR
ncbi:MAG: redoxin domain-containing protein, partial [Alistipes sp.]|nr:redoxin domain-containing protein [Alistipes sp.]